MHSGKPHCRLYRYSEGDCGMLACARCGKAAYARLQARIVRATRQHAQILFLTVYYEHRWGEDFSDLPLFKDQKKQLENDFRMLASKVFRALRDKARRSGMSFEYCVVFALSKVKHRLHKHLHFHALLTWLPDTKPHPTSKKKERLQSSWLEKKLARLHLVMWLEKPRSKDAVARYTAQNAKTVIGKKGYAGKHVVRMSQGYEK